MGFDAQDHGALGQYRTSANIALSNLQAAGAPILSLRWTDPNILFVLQKMRMRYLQIEAATATIAAAFEMRIVRGFTVADSAGSIMTITGNNAKKRTSHATSLVQEIRLATGVAAGLTAGTRTKDVHPFLTMAIIQTVTAINPVIIAEEWDASISEHPIVLAQNEGIIIEGPTTVFGSAGKGNLFVDIAWKEVSAF